MPPPSRQGWGQVQELQAPTCRCRRPQRLRWRCAREDCCAGTGSSVRGTTPRCRCRPLGPWISAWLSWSCGNRWRPEPPWCPCNRWSGRLATAFLKFYFRKVKFQKCSGLDYSKYIQVHTGMYKYVLLQKTAHLIWSCSIHPPAPASLCRMLGGMYWYVLVVLVLLWTFWYEPACFGTYQYVLVHTDIYWYVLYLMTQECFAKQYLVTSQ